ncbi:MAG: hypothetical protein AAF074_07350 [Pseudomonadota bacterium]
MAKYDRHKGVEITNTYFTGHASNILPVLIRSVTQICREGRNVSGHYVGIASGVDYWQALTRRVDDYKLDCGVTRVYLLYESSTEQYTRQLETQLESHFSEVSPDRSLNRTGGGGGRPSAGPKYFLYLAVVKALP